MEIFLIIIAIAIIVIIIKDTICVMISNNQKIKKISFLCNILQMCNSPPM